MSRAVAPLFAAALLVAGCGGSNEAAPREPKLPHALAEQLADQSDAVASRLDAGDSCGAAEQATSLKEEALAAIDSGTVPSAFEDELAASVTELAGRITCEQDNEPGNGEGKGKGKDGEGGKD